MSDEALTNPPMPTPAATLLSSSESLTPLPSQDDGDVDAPQPSPIDRVSTAEEADLSTPLLTAGQAAQTPSLSKARVVETTDEDESLKTRTIPNTREQVTQDLHVWKEKFAVASDQGTKDLEARVESITARQVATQANDIARILLSQLEGTVSSSLEALRNNIIGVVETLSSDSTAEDESMAYDVIHAAIRTAGQAIKEKAQDVRNWKSKYDDETFALVKAASESTLDVIDGIRDLGLQEIGLRWTALTDVTYEDWTEYHALKRTFDVDRLQVVDTAAKHPGLAEARKAGEEVEERAMQIAEAAAKELIRLKEVAMWKVSARDSSEDFASRPLAQAAAYLEEKVSSMINFAKDNTSADPGVATEAEQDLIETTYLADPDATQIKEVGDLSETLAVWRSEDFPASSMTDSLYEDMDRPNDEATATNSVVDAPSVRETDHHMHNMVDELNAEISDTTSMSHIHESDSLGIPEDTIDALPNHLDDPPNIEQSMEPATTQAATLAPDAIVTATDVMDGAPDAASSLSSSMRQAISEAGEGYDELTRSWMAQASASSTVE